eukprot:2829014-Prymnesium_polylepis.1
MTLAVLLPRLAGLRQVQESVPLPQIVRAHHAVAAHSTAAHNPEIITPVEPLQPSQALPHERRLLAEFGSLVPSSAISLGDVIGVGGFAKVYRAEMLQGYREDGSPCKLPVAVKVFRFAGQDDKALTTFIKELRLMRQLDPPNLMPLLGVSASSGISGDTLSMVTELMSRGSVLARSHTPLGQRFP